MTSESSADLYGTATFGQHHIMIWYNILSMSAVKINRNVIYPAAYALVTIIGLYDALCDRL